MESLESGSVANTTYDPTAFGQVKNVVVRITPAGAVNLGEAYTSFGHELRHLTKYNADQQTKLQGNSWRTVSPQEADAERYGIKTKHHFMKGDG